MSWTRSQGCSPGSSSRIPKSPTVLREFRVILNSRGCGLPSGRKMGAKGITERALGPYASRFRSLPRRPRWSGDFLRAETRRALPIVLPVAAAAAFAVAASIHALAVDRPSGSTLAGVAGLLVAATLAEAFPLPIEGVTAGATSLAIVFIV